jgi:hypothetical protein
MAVATIQVPKRVCAYGRDQTHLQSVRYPAISLLFLSTLWYKNPCN